MSRGTSRVRALAQVAGLGALGLAHLSGCGPSKAPDPTGGFLPEETSGPGPDASIDPGATQSSNMQNSATASSSQVGPSTTSSVGTGAPTSGATGTGPDPSSSSECEPGRIKCGLACIDPISDKDYCGAQLDCVGPNAGKACPGLERCENASCTCPDNWIRCKGACINPAVDMAFCGATLDCEGANAGSVCGPNQKCEAGQCSSGCKAGEILCDGNCIDPKGDFNYCGASLDCTGVNAGTRCALGQVCVDGACTANCKLGEILCGNRCVNPNSDNEFCGASGTCTGANVGTNCVAPLSCVAGSCELNCNPWQIKCDGACVNPKSDPKYCGASLDCSGPNAGQVCAPGEICSNGSCVVAGCEEQSFQANLPPSDIMLVIDKSGSMSSQQIPVGGVNTTRWEVLHDVVSDLITDFGAKVRFGLKLYPAATAQTDQCTVDPGVEVSVSDTSSASIMGALPARNQVVFGETPTDSGMTNAVTHLVGVAARTNHPSAIMLIADGGITDENGPPGDRCDGETEQGLFDAADFARSEGLAVYAVGILVDAGERTLLERVALDPDNYLDVSNKTQLEAAVRGILAKVPNCLVPLATPPQYHELMKVATSDGTSTFDAPWLYQYQNCKQATDAGVTRGFVYTKLSGPYDEIDLCGLSCDNYKDTTTVDIQQECPPPP